MAARIFLHRLNVEKISSHFLLDQLGDILIISQHFPIHYHTAGACRMQSVSWQQPYIESSCFFFSLSFSPILKCLKYYSVSGTSSSRTMPDVFLMSSAPCSAFPMGITGTMV